MHTSTSPSYSEETLWDSKRGRTRCIITLLKPIIDKGLSLYSVSRWAESHRENDKFAFQLLHENPKCGEKAYLLFIILSWLFFVETALASVRASTGPLLLNWGVVSHTYDTLLSWETREQLCSWPTWPWPVIGRVSIHPSSANPSGQCASGRTAP